MSLLGKIKGLLPNGEQKRLLEAKKKEIEYYFRRSPEAKDRFPDIFAQYNRAKSESELDEMCKVLKAYTNRESVRKWYLETFEKDVRLQTLYPQSYQQLQKVLSDEEWREFKPVVDKQMKREGRKAKLLERFDAEEALRDTYGDIYEKLPCVVADEEVERYEGIIREYDQRKTERSKWLEYLERFPKLKEKYAKEYERLQQDLSEEEMRDVATILSYEMIFLDSLHYQYEAYVREITELNYATGKVEKLYEGYIGHEELMRKYPEEAEALMEHYRPEFDAFFFGQNGARGHVTLNMPWYGRFDVQFKDMSFYREFIERNHVLERYVITDREYTDISNKVFSYIPRGAIRDIAGTYTGYSLSYEKFLLMKEQYPEDVAYFASQQTGEEELINFISKMHPYLTARKVQYMV